MLLHVLSSAEEDYPTRFIDSEPVDNLMSKSLLEIYEEHWQKFEEQGREFLRSLSREATSVGVNTEFTQRWGNPGRNICESAQTWSADLILVGSRGLTGMKEMFLGSISNYVTHHAPCSVLIVRADADEVMR